MTFTKLTCKNVTQSSIAGKVRLWLSLMVIFSCGSCGTMPKPHIVGEKISVNPSAKPSGLVMASSGSLLKGYDFSTDGIDFKAGVDENDIVIYLETRDVAFKTPEGAAIGTSLRKVRSLTKANLNKEVGWAYFVTLPSGWNVAFAQGAGMTEGQLASSSQVKWLFQRFSSQRNDDSTRLPPKAR